MDMLEVFLKLDKLDPSQVPDSSVVLKDEVYKQMNALWTDVEKLGKQFVADCRTVNYPALLIYVFFSFLNFTLSKLYVFCYPH